MTEKINALVLKVADFKENDKMLLLYCAEYGKITATIRGVKKPNAKLKFAAEQFCFGEYMLSVSGGRYLVTNCSEIDGFYSLRKDVVTYYCAGCVAEQVSVVGQENQSEPDLLVLTLKTLRALDERSVDAKIVLLKFLLESFKIAGFGLTMDKCNMCGNRAFDRMYLNLDAGGTVCPLCKRECLSRELDVKVFNCLRLIDLQPLDKLGVLKFEPYADICLKALEEYNRRILKRLVSLETLLKI